MSAFVPDTTLGPKERALLEAMPERLVVCDAHGTVVHVTESALVLFGSPLDALVGRKLDEVLETERRVDDVLATLVARGIEHPTPVVVLHAAGVRLHTDVVAREATIDGRVLRILSLRGHTATSRAREPLAGELTQIHRALFEQSPIGIFHYDRTLTITACNQAFADILGSPVRVLVGLDMNTLPDQTIVALARRALAGETARLETRYRSVTSGREREIRLLVAPVFDGPTVASALGIVIDVSPQKAAERALANQNALLRAIFANAPDAIGIVVEGRYVQANARLAELMGYASADDVVGQPVSAAVHPSQRATQAARIARVAEGEVLRPIEYRTLRRDGSEGFVEVSSAPFEYEGHPAVLAFGRDVTERRELEARLVRADRLASVGTLAAGVGHELNNPLGYVMLTLELLERRLEAIDPPSRSELGSLLLRAQDGCERIRTIVRDLATFSRRSDGDAVPLDIARVIEHAARLVQHTIRHKASLSIETSGPTFVAGDPARLGQVLVNLLVNAAQAMPDGEATRRTIRVTAEGDGSVVRVRVIDDGPGIPESVLDRVFEPFFTTKPPGEGTGLGLSICHGIVKDHGGTIRIASRVGAGTTVTVELPALREEDGHGAVASPSKAEPAIPSHVLLIDDERAFADTLRDALAETHDVTVAYDGASAIETLRRDASYDLVLCDVMMATSDGPAVYEAIAREVPSLESRVVFMTGGAVTLGVRERLASLGVPILEKPFGVADVDRLLVARRRAQ